MRKDKEKATDLRKLGKSYIEIEKELGVPRSTLSAWFQNQGWSQEISENLVAQAKKGHIVRIHELNKTRGKNLEKLYKQAEDEAIEDFQKLKNHPLFIAALMVYWGEGDKSSRSRCSIANTEPQMIELFLKFLRNVCGMKSPKIKAWILLYPDLDEKICKEFWVTNTSLKLEDFFKSILIQGRHKTKKLSFGVCSVGVSSAYLKCKILKWIELIAQDLTRENYIAGVV